MSIKAIFAHDSNGNIGLGDGLPWPKNKEDMQWFKKNTTNQVVVMGSSTWKSLGNKPLPDRINIVVTRNGVDGTPDDIYYGDMGKVLQMLQYEYPGKDIWVIGGNDILEQSIDYCQFLYITFIPGIYKADVKLSLEFTNKILEKFEEVSHEKMETCTTMICKRIA